MNHRTRISALLALVVVSACQSGSPEPAPQPEPPRSLPEVRQPPPPQPPARAYFVHVRLRGRDDAFQPFEPMSAQSIGAAVRGKGWTSLPAGAQSELASIAASSDDPLPALAAQAPPDTRWLVLATSELEPTEHVGPFPTWKCRLRTVVYDVPGKKTVFDETVEGTGSANDDRQASMDSDQLAGQSMAARLETALPAAP